MSTLTNKKIQAFTLSELLVVLAITTIVVGIAYGVLGLVQGNMFRLQENYIKEAQLELLNQSLWIDLNKYSQAKVNSNTNEWVFKNEIDSVRYEISDSVVIRYPDTFQVAIPMWKAFFDAKEVQNGIIDALEINLVNNEQELSLFLFKENDAAIYMNN